MRSGNGLGPGFFDALGVRVTRGRGFAARDSKPGSEWDLRSAIVTEEFVRRYVPAGDPIGARIAFGTRPDADPTIEIVGVVGDFHSHALRKPEAQIFFALWERSVTDGVFYARMRAGSAVPPRRSGTPSPASIPGWRSCLSAPSTTGSIACSRRWPLSRRARLSSR